MRVVLIIALVGFVAASAWAGVGAELGLGMVGVAVGGILPAAGFYISEGVNFGGTAIAVCSLTATAGTASGVWLAGERWGGRSENRVGSFLGSLAGASAAMAFTGLIFYTALSGDQGTDVNEAAYIPPGILFLTLGVPAGAVLGYHIAKKPAAAAAESRALPVAPTISALPPRSAGEKPTLTFGVAWAF